MAIPLWQWEIWAQYIQMGLVSFTFRTNMSLVGGKPLKMASLVAAWQGSEKVDRVTEWPAAKVNSIVSPAAALIVSGVKTSPFLPTATWWIVDAEAAAAALVAVLVVAVEDGPELPYCASVPDSIRVHMRRDIDGDMAYVCCASSMDEA